jgi:hypothetical protein
MSNELNLWNKLHLKWSSSVPKDIVLYPKIVGNPLGRDLTEFYKRHPMLKNSFLTKGQCLADQITLLSKKYRVLVFFIATTKGMHGSERIRGCHGVIFIIINDDNVRKCMYLIDIMILYLFFFCKMFTFCVIYRLLLGSPRVSDCRQKAYWVYN